MALDKTHDPQRQSWVESANAADTDFPLQNLPHAVFRRKHTDEPLRGGVAIGDRILDVAYATQRGVFAAEVQGIALAAAAPALNRLMGLGRPAWRRLRAELLRVLELGAPEASRLRDCLLPQEDAEYGLPASIGDYTDFFTSYHHMVNAGRVFRPDAPPLPNFKWFPIAYHGRSSSIEISGTTFHRPLGQTKRPGATVPVFGPSQRLDYELELAFWVGAGNARGRPIAVDDAEDHIFGMSLLNDWSARDVQAWEALPLGPFLAKNFFSTVSPWVVTLEALEPFRCALPREADDPATLPNLAVSEPRPGFDLQLEAWLQTAQTSEPVRLSYTSFKHCYWSMAQMLAHHTEGGCNLRPGDLIGTGTQSGPAAGEQGCLLELTHGGARPLRLAGGATRTFLEDGDTVTLRAWAEKAGARRIGFGECSGTVLPARDVSAAGSPLRRDSR